MASIRVPQASTLTTPALTPEGATTQNGVSRPAPARGARVSGAAFFRWLREQPMTDDIVLWICIVAVSVLLLIHCTWGLPE